MPDLPLELGDLDCNVCCLRADRTTRGKARAYAASERGLSFTDSRVWKRHYRIDTEGNAERAADGQSEPYDGWPLIECAKTDPDGAAYWCWDNEDTDA